MGHFYLRLDCGFEGSDKKPDRGCLQDIKFVPKASIIVFILSKYRKIINYLNDEVDEKNK